MRALLDFIAKYESNGNYNIVWGGIAPADRPPKQLTDMTIQQVLDWQDSIDAQYMSEASGRYQIMEDTLRGLWREAGCKLSDLYNQQTQNKLGTALLRRRGLDDYLSGKMSRARFGNALAREWASLPCVSGPKTGKSYYAGDGLNKAHAPLSGFLEALDATRNNDRPSQTIDIPSEAPLAGIGGTLAVVAASQDQLVLAGVAVAAMVALFLFMRAKS